MQLVVREEERVRARRVRVEVDDVPAREVACEEEVEGVCAQWVWEGCARGPGGGDEIGPGSGSRGKRGKGEWDVGCVWWEDVQFPCVCSHFPFMFVSQKEVMALSTFCCVCGSFQKS